MCLAAPLMCPECPHQRDDHTDDECGMLCGLIAQMLATPEGHAEWHKVGQCRTCHRKLREVTRTCVNLCCTVVLCYHCGNRSCSWGPMGCDCDDRIKPIPTLSRRSAHKWRKP